MLFDHPDNFTKARVTRMRGVNRSIFPVKIILGYGGLRELGEISEKVWVFLLETCIGPDPIVVVKAMPTNLSCELVGVACVAAGRMLLKGIDHKGNVSEEIVVC